MVVLPLSIIQHPPPVFIILSKSQLSQLEKDGLRLPAAILAQWQYRLNLMPLCPVWLQESLDLSSPGLRSQQVCKMVHTHALNTASSDKWYFIYSRIQNLVKLLTNFICKTMVIKKKKKTLIKQLNHRNHSDSGRRGTLIWFLFVLCVLAFNAC